MPGWRLRRQAQDRALFPWDSQNLLLPLLIIPDSSLPHMNYLSGVFKFLCNLTSDIPISADCCRYLSPKGDGGLSSQKLSAAMQILISGAGRTERNLQWTCTHRHTQLFLHLSQVLFCEYSQGRKCSIFTIVAQYLTLYSVHRGSSIEFFDR